MKVVRQVCPNKLLEGYLTFRDYGNNNNIRRKLSTCLTTLNIFLFGHFIAELLDTTSQVGHVETH